MAEEKLCDRHRRARRLTETSYGRSVCFDFLAGLLDFRGITAPDLMASFEGFLARRFCSRFGAGFALPPDGIFFLGVRVLTARFLALDGVLFRESNVPLMPAWAIDTALWTLSRILLIPMAHHAKSAQLLLVQSRSQC